MNASVDCDQAPKWNGAKKKIGQPRSPASPRAERDGGVEKKAGGKLSNYDVTS